MQAQHVHIHLLSTLFCNTTHVTIVFNMRPLVVAKKCQEKDSLLLVLNSSASLVYIT